MPAQSPKLPIALSAITAAFRGSSFGMPFSTCPTKAAPPSAALVKMPPPSRTIAAVSALRSPNASVIAANVGDNVGACGPAGAVAHVVAHVVGDHRGVPGVVLWDAFLHLPHQVGANVGGLGEDAPAHPHEHGQERSPEPEPDQHAGRVVLARPPDHRRGWRPD